MIELLNIDCMEYMAGLPDNAFDLAITDPPYGIGKDWKKSKRSRFQNLVSTYDNASPHGKEYFDQLFRVSRNQIIWGYNYYAHLLPLTNNIIVWDKDLLYEKGLKSEGELAWTSVKKYPLRIYKHQWDGCKKGTENGKIQTINPHQKPVALYRWQLHYYANIGDKILDTHAGSASLGVACHLMGFDYVGCEIDKKHFTDAQKRISEAKKQQLLFV
jgi:site-specific DNA-methyltransferase (adenine-specific)